MDNSFKRRQSKKDFQRYHQQAFNEYYQSSPKDNPQIGQIFRDSIKVRNSNNELQIDNSFISFNDKLKIPRTVSQATSRKKIPINNFLSTKYFANTNSRSDSEPCSSDDELQANLKSKQSIFERSSSQRSQGEKLMQSPSQHQLYFRSQKKIGLSPKKQKQLPVSFIQRNQQINQELYRKWMSDVEIKNIVQKFHHNLMAFIKQFPQKALQKILKLIEFKTYLKPLFVNDNTSIIQLQNDINLDSICSRAFSLKLYESFINERYTLIQINQLKQAQKQLKQTQNKKEIQQLQQIIAANKVPSYNEFIKEVLLVDLAITAEKMEDSMIKKDTDAILILGEQLKHSKQQIENLEVEILKKQQKKRIFGAGGPQLQRFLQNNTLASFQQFGNVCLLDNVQKVKYHQFGIIIRKD